jgi:hypothetical protein
MKNVWVVFIGGKENKKRMDESMVFYPARFLSNCQRIAKNGTATADET